MSSNITRSVFRVAVNPTFLRWLRCQVADLVTGRLARTRQHLRSYADDVDRADLIRDFVAANPGASGAEVIRGALPGCLTRPTYAEVLATPGIVRVGNRGVRMVLYTAACLDRENGNALAVDFRTLSQAERDIAERAEARAKVAKEYNLSPGGKIQNPGKFESCHWTAVTLYAAMMDGCAEDMYIGYPQLPDDEDCIPENWRPTAVFDPDPVLFPDTPSHIPTLYEDDQGFVSADMMAPDWDPEG